MEVLNLYEQYKNKEHKSSLTDYTQPSINYVLKNVIPYHRIDTEPCSYDDYKYDAGQFKDATFTFEGSNCINCNHPFITPDDYHIIQHQSVLFAIENSYQCSVQYHQCKQCHHVNVFDGLDEHIFNHKGIAIYTHSLLNHRTNHWHSNRASSWESWRSGVARWRREWIRTIPSRASMKMFDSWLYILRLESEFICPLI